MVESNAVGSSKPVSLTANDKTEKNTNPVVKEKTNNPLQKNDNSKFNNQTKGVPSSGVEFNQDEPKEIIHTVKAGETLSIISAKYFGDKTHYKEIFNLNKSKDFPTIETPIEIGQAIKIPKTAKVTRASAVDNKSAVQTNNKPIDVKEKKKISIDPYTPLIDQNKDSSLVEVDVLDAVKVNKKYDIDPKLLNNTNIKTEFDKWATKAAGILDENKASIVIAAKDGKKYNVNAKFLNNLADTLANDRDQGYLDIRHFFRDDLGIAFFNTVWAIDDLAYNLKTDPYYSEIKEQKKVFDLSTVAKNYHLDNDKQDYMSNLLDHGHRSIPVYIETTPPDNETPKLPAATATEIIDKLSESFDKKGNLKHGDDFEDQVYALLDDKDSRKTLIDYFKINSKENLDSLVPAITGEAGVAKTQQDYNSYFSVGSVMVNRTLGRNLMKYAKATAQQTPENKIKPVTVKNILSEEGQFAITWEKAGGTQTIFDSQASLNDKYKKGKLNESGNSSTSFKLVNEVTTDLFDGMNHLKADIDGESTKNAGRSTSDIFYFNQSHSNDYSGKNYSDSAVKLIDVNDTQVFFKTWDGNAFFRYE